MRTIAFYGKGGIGKTTVAANLSVLFARAGRRVLQIGCDPKHDSCYTLVDRAEVRTVMGLLRDRRDRELAKEDFVLEGRDGIHCVETGGPEPGLGCAGRGITRMLEILALTQVLDEGYDVVAYDVLGDVVCGGFAAPIRSGYAREVYVVTSGEVMSLYAANNICRAVVRHRRAGASIAGVVGNMRGFPGEQRTLEAFADVLGVRLLPLLERDPAVQDAEAASTPVVAHAPSSAAARGFARLFEEIRSYDVDREEVGRGEPRPMSDDDFESFVLDVRRARVPSG